MSADKLSTTATGWEADKGQTYGTTAPYASYGMAKAGETTAIPNASTAKTEDRLTAQLQHCNINTTGAGSALSVPSGVKPEYTYDTSSAAQLPGAPFSDNHMNMVDPLYNPAASYVAAAATAAGWSQMSQYALPHAYGYYGYSADYNWLHRPGFSGKRGRMTYMKWQTGELELEFATSQYINRSKRKDLSQRTQLSERQIKIWFQNRRMKLKKEKKAVRDGGGTCSPSVDSNDDRRQVQGQPNSVAHISSAVPVVPNIGYPSYQMYDPLASKSYPQVPHHYFGPHAPHNQMQVQAFYGGAMTGAYEPGLVKREGGL